MRQRGRGADILEARRLAAAGVVGDRDHHAGNGEPMLLQERLEALEIDIALEWMRRRRVKALGGRKVDRLLSGGLDIAAVVSKWVFED
jgi:hypothetical protein